MEKMHGWDPGFPLQGKRNSRRFGSEGVPLGWERNQTIAILKW